MANKFDKLAALGLHPESIACAHRELPDGAVVSVTAWKQEITEEIVDGAKQLLDIMREVFKSIDPNVEFDEPIMLDEYHCGYVRLPPGLELSRELADCLPCYGGVTYYDNSDEENGTVVGFDTAHFDNDGGGTIDAEAVLEEAVKLHAAAVIASEHSLEHDASDEIGAKEVRRRVMELIVGGQNN